MAHTGMSIVMICAIILHSKRRHSCEAAVGCAHSAAIEKALKADVAQGLMLLMLR